MPTSFKKIKNRVLTTIKVASGINNTDDPVVFNITDETDFPVVPFYFTVEVINDDTVYERMLCTDLTGDQITATRAQDGSAKQTFNAGDLVMIRVIAAHVDEITGAVNDLEDIKDYADSPMIITGGAVSEGTNAGTFKVAALTALLRKTDSLTGELVEVSLAEQDNQAITAADTTYFVVLNYNGGAPTISVSATNPYTADKRNIPIGKVRKDGADNVHYINSAFGLQDGVRKLHERSRELRELELESGSAIAYSGTNNFTLADGVVYGGINRIALGSYDSAAVVFTYIYQDGGGGWTEVINQNVIDFAHFDDGDGTPGNIGNNKYSCHWVYRHSDDGHVFVVLGRGNYTLGQAEAALEPTRPSHLTDFGCLIGKIIAPQVGGSFTTIQMVTERFFTGTAPSDHGNLGGLSDDDHTQYALLAGRSGGQTLIGGTASGEDLTLQSTSHGTKGYIYLGAAQTSYFDEVNENLIISGGASFGGDTVWQGLAADRKITMEVYSATDTHCGRLYFQKSGQDTVGYTETVNNEYLGLIRVFGVNSNDNDVEPVAEILFFQDGASGAAHVPGAIVFRTGTNAAAPADALVINQNKAVTFYGETIQQVLATQAISSKDTYSTTNSEYSQLKFRKSAQATVGYATTADDENLGGILAYGVGGDADAWNIAAGIIFEQDAAAQNNGIAGRIVMKTTTDAEPGVWTTALTIASDQIATFTQCLVDGTCWIFDKENALRIIRDIMTMKTSEKDEYGHYHQDMEKIYQDYPYLIHKTKMDGEDFYGDKLGARSDLLYRAVLQLEERIKVLENN